MLQREIFFPDLLHLIIFKCKKKIEIYQKILFHANDKEFIHEWNKSNKMNVARLIEKGHEKKKTDEIIDNWYTSDINKQVINCYQ